MSSSEKFCLRWNDFETNISLAFRELREEKDFFDVTLACDDSQVQAHKVILSACSPFFRNVLRRNPHQHPLLYLKGVKYKELLSVLNFMYMGEVNVAQEELNSFLAVAEDLRVKGLTQNNASDSSSSKPKQDQPKNILPRPRETPDREPVPPPPPKRPRPITTPAQTFSNYSQDDDIQEVVPVKSEPRDPAPVPVHTSQVDNSHSVSQYEVVQQQQAAPSGLDQQNTVALDESYGDESYDYGQYDDGTYDDGSGMIDPNTGMPFQGASADGNKELDLQINLMLFKQPNGTWNCTECGYSSKIKTNLKMHIESKHIVSSGFLCPLCNLYCPNRKCLKNHMDRKHKKENM